MTELTEGVLSLCAKTGDGKMKEADSVSTFSLFTDAGALLLRGGYLALLGFSGAWLSQSRAAAGSAGAEGLQLSNASVPSSWMGCRDFDLDTDFNLLLALDPGMGE